MPTEDFEEAQYLSSQVEQARQRAVLAASDAGAARSDAAGSEQAAREYARRAQAAADATSGAPQNAAEAKAAAASAIAASGAADTAKAEAQAAAAISSTAAATAKQEAIADATTKYGGLPGRIATVEASTQAIDAPVGFDANSVAKQAVHMVHTNDAAVNMPGPGSWLLQTWPQGGSALLQEAILYNGTAPEIHTRRSYEGSWSAWVRLDAGKWATRLVTIEATATQDREAALADASTKANTAKAEAIAAASSDATTKTNAARDAAAADASAKAETAETRSKAYTDQVVNTSHLASDTDGTPYYSPGSMTLRVFTDTDGVPFFFEA